MRLVRRAPRHLLGTDDQLLGYRWRWWLRGARPAVLGLLSLGLAAVGLGRRRQLRAAANRWPRLRQRTQGAQRCGAAVSLKPEESGSTSGDRTYS